MVLVLYTVTHTSTHIVYRKLFFMELEMFADGCIILIGSKWNLHLKNEEKLHGLVCLVRFIYDAII